MRLIKFLPTILLAVLFFGCSEGGIIDSNAPVVSFEPNNTLEVDVFAKGGGFDEFGYNRSARIFNGSVGGWCAQRGWDWDCSGYPAYAPYANDKLKMKWNSEWDRGNEEGWTDPDGYDAWIDNQYNGAFPSGSGEVWHYKIRWDAGCRDSGTPSSSEGGYCIWGQFVVLMDQGTADGEHFWFAHALPTGYNN